jgi:hypothetical protein
MTQLLRRILTAIAPAELHDWIDGVLAETPYLPSRERIGWYVSAVRVAVAFRISRSALSLQAGLLAVTLVVVDWTWGALLPALALIGVSAAVLARGSVDRSRAALWVAGGTLPVAHAVANWVPRLRPSYQYAPLDLRDWAILAAVGGIGLCAVRIADAFRSGWNRFGGNC